MNNKDTNVKNFDKILYIEVIKILTATYSVNGKRLEFNELKKIEITKKDYIDYIESIKKKVNNFHVEIQRKIV